MIEMNGEIERREIVRAARHDDDDDDDDDDDLALEKFVTFIK